MRFLLPRRSCLHSSLLRKMSAKRTNLASGKLEGKVYQKNVQQWFSEQKSFLMTKFKDSCEDSDNLHIDFQENVEFTSEECLEREVEVCLLFDAYCKRKF